MEGEGDLTALEMLSNDVNSLDGRVLKVKGGKDGDPPDPMENNEVKKVV